MATQSATDTKSLLFNAIEAADLDTLKHVLSSICRASVESTALSMKMLLIPRGSLALEPHKVTETADGSDESEEDEDESEEDEDEGEEDDEDEEVEEVADGLADGYEREGQSDEDDSEEEQERPSKRRKTERVFTGYDAVLISRYETCSECKQRFDVTLNHSRACRIHPGMLELSDDVDAWADDDQYRYDPSSIDPESDWRRKDNPECFIWECCDGNGHAKPCQISRHVI